VTVTLWRGVGLHQRTHTVNKFHFPRRGDVPHGTFLKKGVDSLVELVRVFPVKIDLTTITNSCPEETPTHICVLPLVGGKLVMGFGFDTITVYLIDESGVRLNVSDKIQTCIRKQIENEITDTVQSWGSSFKAGRGIININHDKIVTINIEYNGCLMDEDDLFPFYNNLRDSLHSLFIE
jgi:hypothetical protein